ncbi:hypothetical protein RYX36_016969, partial [Vicia faba]
VRLIGYCVEGSLFLVYEYSRKRKGRCCFTIACYINEMDVSEENARKHIQEIINGAWKKINGLCSTQNALMKPFFNQARNAALHELTDEIVDFSHTYQDLVYNVSLIIRLCIDLATTTVSFFLILRIS